MNPIFHLNMTMMLNSEKVSEPVVKKRTRLKQGSKARSIIEYLLEYGKTSGSILMQELNLDLAPLAYMQPHVNAGRVIVEKVNMHRANYSINKKLTKDDFNL